MLGRRPYPVGFTNGPWRQDLLAMLTIQAIQHERTVPPVSRREHGSTATVFGVKPKEEKAIF